MADEASEPSSGERPVTRAEYERLLRRIERLEAQAPQPRAPVARVEPEPAPRPPIQAPALRETAPVVAPAAPAQRPVGARPSGPGLEAQLGRFAPRIGAVLVFLASLFFLGVAIERGWIGPIGQLVLASTGAAALLGIAAWLTRSRGYGTYPQVLEATGVCVLYATAFVAQALPYYSEATRLTEMGGGLLMALVAALAVVLALLRDSRVIVGIGYSLGFLTAGFGWGVLPGLTLTYVALLGASLAFVAAWRAWHTEGLLGSFATGVFFIAFAYDAHIGGLSPWSVALAAAVPFAAFTWLSMRRLPATPAKNAMPPALLPALTLGWAAWANVLAFPDLTQRGIGVVLFGWLGLALGLAYVASRVDAPRDTLLANGVAAVALYAVAVPFFWNGADDPLFAVTLSYGLAGLALAATHRGVPTLPEGVWRAGFALAGLAALTTVLGVDALRWADEVDRVGAWAAGLESAVVAGALLTLHHRRTLEGVARGTRLVLVAGSAAVLASYLLAYTEGAWTSILLGALGVAYLGVGWVLKRPAYRYTGFGALAGVVLRVFTVDLQEADLAVRALVFAVLGGILLAVGYGYARANREREQEDADAPAPR